MNKDFHAGELLRVRAAMQSQAISMRLTIICLVMLGIGFSALTYQHFRGPKAFLINAQTGEARAAWIEVKPVWQEADENQRMFFLKTFLRTFLNTDPRTRAGAMVETLNWMTPSVAETQKNTWEAEQHLASVVANNRVTVFDLEQAQIRPLDGSLGYSFVIRGTKKVSETGGSETQFVQIFIRLENSARTESNPQGLLVNEIKEEVISRESK